MNYLAFCNDIALQFALRRGVAVHKSNQYVGRYLRKNTEIANGSTITVVNWKISHSDGRHHYVISDGEFIPRCKHSGGGALEVVTAESKSKHVATINDHVVPGKSNKTQFDSQQSRQLVRYHPLRRSRTVMQFGDSEQLCLEHWGIVTLRTPTLLLRFVLMY